jgi:beta-glucosidase
MMKNIKYLALIALIALMAACSQPSTDTTFDAEDWSRINTCEYDDSENESLIRDLIGKMSIEQKVGQVIQGDLDFISPADVNKYYIGSVLNGGNTSPNADKYSSVKDWKNLSKEFYDASLEIDGLKIPVLWGTDAVHGHNNIIGATLFPHNIGLGATGNATLVKQIGEAIALEVLSTGVVWTFAPTIAVPQDDRWGRTYEGFSEDPALVSTLGRAMILGLQGEGSNFLDGNHVAATAKHFMGDGGTLNGVDQGNTLISKEGLRNIHGQPYFQALDACAQTVMASFNSWNGSKLHGDKDLLTEILKNSMQFDGFVIGDWNGHGQVPGCSNTSCSQAFNAGIDMFMAPEDWKELLSNTIAQVKSGEIPTSRLDDAVIRILRVKSRMGLLDERKPHAFETNYLGHPKHIDLARQAVRESLVLLKNNSQVLPLNPKRHVGIIGGAANKISSQTGGWTITWQGRENKNSDFVDTKTIFEIIDEAVNSSGGTVEFSDNGIFDQTPDYVIGVFGEEPYAEMLGDLQDVSFTTTDPNYLSQLQKISSQKIKTVSIFLSGRPLEVNQYINASDAFIAAWLPGTAVEGISDVIFSKDGEAEFDFLGKLAYSWPKDKLQTELNHQNKTYDPLFPFGFGLDYSSKSELAMIESLNTTQKMDSINIFLGAAAIPGEEFTLTQLGPEYVTEDKFSSSDGTLNISRFDYLRQDDAKNFVFSESDSMKGFGISANTDLNLTSMKSPYYEVVMRINETDELPLYFSLSCGESCQGSVALPLSQTNAWQTISVPLRCLERAGLDKSKINIRSLFLTRGAINFDLHSIIIKEANESISEISC